MARRPDPERIAAAHEAGIRTGCVTIAASSRPPIGQIVSKTPGHPSSIAARVAAITPGSLSMVLWVGPLT
jgi:hypothetical protein